MQGSSDICGVTADVVTACLDKAWPFAGSDKQALKDLADGCTRGFYPKDTVIIQQDSAHPDHLFFIERGAVRLFRKEADGRMDLADFRDEGSLFGVAALLGERIASLTVEAAEDTSCLQLDKAKFLAFVRQNPAFVENYFRCLSDDLVCRTYASLEAVRLQEKPAHELRLANATVEDAVRGLPHIIDMTMTVHRAARLMTEMDVSALLVRDADDAIVGILSDKDIRAQVVAERADYDQPVASVMTRPTVDITPYSSCLDAVLHMMDSGTQHLVVKRGEAAIGVVSAQDLLALQGISPLLLLKEIDSQAHFEGLYELGNEVPRLVQNLVDSGAKANSITSIISVLNDHILDRLLSLLQEELGPPPVPFSWIVMGSEGRMEQTLRTDQDNAILYQDLAEDWEQIKSAKLYIRSLGNEAIKHLVKCGYPLCKGGYMASKTIWRKPYSVWIGYFDRWMSTSDKEEILSAKIFLDFRRSFGSRELTDRLRNHVNHEAQRNKFFIKRLARDSLAIRPPLSFFRNFIVESDGEHKNRIDLKMRGLVPVVDFARAMAMKHGIQDTNTVRRLHEIQTQGHAPRELCEEILASYDFLMHLRLLHQLRMIQDGREPDNFLDPVELSDLEKQTLKGAFGIINRMQTFMAKLSAEM